MIKKIKKFFYNIKNNNKILVYFLIISFSAITITSFAMPHLLNKDNDINIEVELVEISKNKKLTRDGDTNIGNGGNGGDYEDGSGRPDNILENVQDEGVRVTLVESETNTPVTIPIDFANNPRQPIKLHFGKFSKLAYLNGTSLISNTSEYTYEKPKQKLPKIVNGNLSTIKKYFGDEVFAKDFSKLTGFSYEEMTSGKYKLMLEPVGYPKIQNIVTACTSTELALLDKRLNGYIRKSWIQMFSHLNLPMAMYLERDEFGIKKWTGSDVQKQSNDTIIAQLGVGAVTFKDEEEETPPEVNYTYRTDTEVITTIQLSGIDCTLKLPTEEKENLYPVTVNFEIKGKNYPASNGEIVFPDGASSLAYLKWKTPKKPQEMIIKATVNYKVIDYRDNGNGGSIAYIKPEKQEINIGVKLEELKENVPPNPDADDRNEFFSNNYKEDDIEKYTENLSNEWKSYEAYWFPKMVEVKKDVWVDRGWYKFNTIYYNAELKANMDLRPASTVKTAKGDEMKSGYGVDQLTKAEIKVSAEIEREIEVPLEDENGNVVTDAEGNVVMTYKKIKEPYFVNSSECTTKVQNGASFFSDFYFKTYWRLLEETNTKSRTEAIMQFKPNKYSTYNNRTHFTPIWYPDDEYYKVATYIFDGWTPVGMLSTNLEDTVYIMGNLWDDWYVQPLPSEWTPENDIFD